MSVNVAVDLNAEDIQKHITQAILDSAIGVELKKALETLAADWKLDTYWSGTMSKIVERTAREIIVHEVEARISVILKAKVGELFTDELIMDIAREGVNTLERRWRER